MLIFSKTDKGRIRETNQDAFFCCEMSDSSVLAIVCDGMGGANAGNIASETAVKRITEYVTSSYRLGMDSFEIEKLLKNAIISANIEIYGLSLKHTELSGMGTTAVVAFVKEKEAVIAYVGDSRAYKISSSISQLTTDHSVVQTLIEDGRLTAEQAKFHPRKNVITRAIGVEENVVADIVVCSVEGGEYLLLCSDGLTNFIEQNQIKKIFDENKGQQIVEALVDKANENGGGDNITVALVCVEH